MSAATEHIVVGLSGGVDSAVAAALLKDRGFRVTALFMKNWEEDDDAEYCAAAVDLADAESVCSRIGIELKTINFSHEYWERVFARFLDDYNAGRTPNPDVLCNREIKFKEFIDYACTLGANRIATGHYAGIRRTGQGTELLRARDEDKDQSYFLYGLDRRALNQCIFPLHQLRKTEVRGIAEHLGLSVHDKKDSTGICFIGERRFRDFLARYVDTRSGPIHDLCERIVGQHPGLTFYTIGQRQGLGIGGSGEPWYVIDKDLDRNILYVAQSHDHPALYSSWLTASELNWVSGSSPDLPLTCSAKIRYRQPDQPCVVEAIGNGAATIRFTSPQRAVTPGQAVVFYDGAVCLGGGTIRDCEALRRRESTLTASAGTGSTVSAYP